MVAHSVTGQQVQVTRRRNAQTANEEALSRLYNQTLPKGLARVEGNVL